MAVYNHYKRVNYASEEKQFVPFYLFFLIFACYACCSEVIEYHDWNDRLGADLDGNEVKQDDFDTVELEKSNVLLMGPTGCGMDCITLISR